MSMSAAPADARRLGHNLHDLVAALEPTRWEDEQRSRLHTEFGRARRELDQAVDAWSNDPRLAPVRGRLEELSRLIGEHLPSASDGRERWMEFRQRVHPVYEDLAQALSACHVELPSLRPTNYARSGFHALAGVVALLMVEFAPWWVVIAVPVTFASLFWTDLIAHPHERYRVNSSTWFATALSLLALTHEPVVAAAGVMTLGLGDPAAALVGRKFGRVELVYSRTLEGTLTFFMVSVAAVLAVLFTFHGEFSLAAKIVISATAGVAGALTELFSRRVDDNFAIPVVTGAVVWGVLALWAAV